MFSTASGPTPSAPIPSGDHVAGGDFAFRFNVLPADFNGDGQVTLNPDVQNMLSGLGSTIGAGDY